MLSGGYPGRHIPMVCLSCDGGETISSNFMDFVMLHHVMSIHLNVAYLMIRIRHSMGKHLPGYLPDSTRQTRVPAYVIPTGSTTRGYG